MRPITIVLSHGWPVPTDPTGKQTRYRVEKVTNSTEFSPHEFVNKREVDIMCAAKDWTVTIVPRKEEK